MLHNHAFNVLCLFLKNERTLLRNTTFNVPNLQYRFLRNNGISGINQISTSYMYLLF